MTRLRIPSYTGAVGASLDPDAGLRLDPDRYAWQIKSDGIFCRLTTDAHGRIDSATSQNGRPIAAAADLIGIHAAPPYSTLDGEAMVQTEAGNAATADLGYVQVHLFDCLRLAGVPLARLPYVERHGSLYRAASWCESEGLARRREWTTDRHGDAHAIAPADPGSSSVRHGRVDLTLHRATDVSRAGRYVAAIPRDLRRLPVIPLHRGLTAARDLWSTVERDGLEGLVAVDLRAPVGRPGSKRKIKVTDTLDCTVLESEAAHSRVVVAGPRPLDFIVPGYAEVGAIVEVRHHGFYGSGIPRFPRLVRYRPDKLARGPYDFSAIEPHTYPVQDRFL